jgi:hypothetical protein
MPSEDQLKPPHIVRDMREQGIGQRNLASKHLRKRRPGIGIGGGGNCCC